MYIRLTRKINRIRNSCAIIIIIIMHDRVRWAGRRARARSFYRARAHAHPGRSCDSFNPLAKKLVSRFAASFAKPLKD